MLIELAAALAQAIDAVVESPAPSLSVTGAEIEMPLEVTAAVRDGAIVIFGGAPHTRWVSGVLPPVNRVTLRVGVADVEMRCGR